MTVDQDGAISFCLTHTAVFMILRTLTLAVANYVLAPIDPIYEGRPYDAEC